MFIKNCVLFIQGASGTISLVVSQSGYELQTFKHDNKIKK